MADTDDQTGHGFGIGRLTTVTDAAGRLSRFYDERGNILTESRVDGNSYASHHDYLRCRQSYFFDHLPLWLESVIYAGRMCRITAMAAQLPGESQPQAVVSGVAYEPFGPVSALTYSRRRC